ncbi:MAG: hypothetical protein NVSMB6_26230 [Burkholderiaceae bacterium]
MPGRSVRHMLPLLFVRTVFSRVPDSVEMAIAAAYGRSQTIPARSTGQVGPNVTVTLMPELGVDAAVRHKAAATRGTRGVKRLFMGVVFYARGSVPIVAGWPDDLSAIGSAQIYTGDQNAIIWFAFQPDCACGGGHILAIKGR